MSEFPSRYPGSSKARNPDGPPSLEEAIIDAYEKGLAAKSESERIMPDGTKRTFQFKVDEIFVEGHNPPSDYRVFLIDR